MSSNNILDIGTCLEHQVIYTALYLYIFLPSYFNHYQSASSLIKLKALSDGNPKPTIF